MNKFSKIVIALNILFGLAFVATVIYADSIRLFTTGAGLIVSSTLFVCCVTYDYFKNHRRSTTKIEEH